VRRSAANVLVREAWRAVDELLDLGVSFDADRHGNLALGLEGGHTVRRVVHAGGSATGRRVVRQLSALVAEERGITVLERARAARLWTDRDGRCVGLVCEDGRAVSARATILATGGAAALWSRTTNPPGSVGIGMQLAHAAGAALADLEFVQFHPTAVTGVPGREGSTHVRLDMRAIDPARFPNVVGALRESGLDPATEYIPVAPASHYFMGGVVADLDGGTTVPGLYAIGETSCTGLHGANRLASNSLTECFVWGRRAALAGLDEPALADPGAPPPGGTIELPSPETRAAMWEHAGIERTPEGLRLLLDDAHPLARLIAACALHREESRGAHWRTDRPATDPALDGQHTVLRGDGRPIYEPWR
jgi:L-aspartate oxidase